MTAQSVLNMSWPARQSVALSVALVSAAVLGFEISLMRMLLVASWHHFAFVVISIAMLGFGVSGTFLSVFRGWFSRHGDGALLALAAATAAAMPLCSLLAGHMPVEARFLPTLLWRQLGMWLAYWAVLTIPFLLGASVIGLGLMRSHERMPAVYGANLLGSAGGCIAAPLVMHIVRPEWLPLVWGVCAMPAVLWAPYRTVRARGAVAAGCAIIVGVWLCADRPRIQCDPYKYAGHLERLARQGSASCIATVIGPRSVVGLWRSEVFHDLPFLSSGVAPPPLDAMVIDGHWAGSVLRITETPQAAVVDRTLVAAAYAMCGARPRVLLLGETGSTNMWLALRHAPESVDVVQGDPGVIHMLRRFSSVVRGNVQLVTAEPRHFVEHSNGQYDLIQLVSLQGSAVGSAGMAGLGQDHLATVEGITACLRRLSPGGLIVTGRGIQTPPRDSLKLLGTLIEALRRIGVNNPQDHIAMFRDYQWVCILASASPWSAEQIQSMRRSFSERELTPVYYPGIQPGELNQPDALPGPAGGVGDWYYHAAMELFSARAERFIAQWLFDIRPATDDRPFFHDFGKLRLIGALRRTLGDLWLTRVELAFLFVLGTIAAVAVVGVVMTIAPLLLLPDLRHGRGKTSTAAYFAAIGLAYMVLEMTLLSRMTHLIGDPVQAASVTIAGFLVFSSAASLVAQRLLKKGGRSLGGIVVALVCVAGVELALLGRLAHLAGALPLPGRYGMALLAIAPLAFLMGFPMPLALWRVDRAQPSLIPWAWGVNGFASVLAAPAATAIGMAWGFTYAGAAAMVLYLLAAAVFRRLPQCQAP